MTTAIPASGRRARRWRPRRAPQAADALVIFGITGDLAKVMTFHALYRLEQRTSSTAPSSAWPPTTGPTSSCRPRARVIVTGEQIDEQVFARLAERMSYVSGDFADDATYRHGEQAIAGKQQPVFYLEVPPSLFATVIKGLAGAGSQDAHVVVEKPFGHDPQSAMELAANPPVPRRVPAPAHRPLPRQDGARGDPLPALRQHAAGAGVEPQLVESVQITMAEDFGVEDRGHFYDPVGALRDVVVNHLMQVVAAATMEPPAGGDSRS